MEDFTEDVAEEGSTPEETLSGKILVADDDEHKRNILYRRLRKNGHKVLLAENGHAALEIVEKDSVDLILLDILMPGFTGTEVLKKLKNSPLHKNIPVLVISSLNDVESVVECIRIGAEDYLPMPFNPVLLMARVQACLDKKYLRDQEIEKQKELERTYMHLNVALESIEDGFAVFNSSDEMILCNQTFQDLYPATKMLSHSPYSFGEFLEVNYKCNRYKLKNRRESDPQESFENWVHLRLYRHQFSHPYMEQLSDERWVQITEKKTSDGGFISIHKDVTTSKKDQERLEFLAHHDPLTGLGNRALFEKILKSIHEKTLKNKKNYAILYLDLDDFKKINDTFGHEFGDHMLIDVGNELSKIIRCKDTISRLGGDEFAIIIENISDMKSLQKTAERILKSMISEVQKGGEQVVVGMSIGIAVYPQDASSWETLLTKADQAMYAAKKAGKGVYRMAQDL